MVAHAAAVAL
uniref:Uncharacterized protein n=1 Tax=Arundo donax TaxID=35708 RepID=A0A0A8ZXN5_ARUDO